MSDTVSPVAWQRWGQGREDMYLDSCGEWVYHVEAQATVAALQSRITELEKDAARYQELHRAAVEYMDNYLLDELDEVELCVCGKQQHTRLQAMFAARRAIEATK